MDALSLMSFVSTRQVLNRLLSRKPLLTKVAPKNSMASNESEMPTSTTDEYLPARSRTPSVESASSHRATIAPLAGDGRRPVGVSSNAKREYKDKRIYVNQRTGLPVRPPTSFALFKHALRRNMKNKVGFLEFNKKATGKWNKMSAEEKEPFVTRSKTLLEQYKKIEVHYLRKKLRTMQRVIKEQTRRY